MFEESSKPISIRYTTRPTKFDCEPFGTICSLVKNDEGTEQEYVIQISKDENDPHWVSASELLVLIHKDKLSSIEFINELIASFDPS